MLEKVSFQLLSNFKVFVDIWWFILRWFLGQKVFHFNFALILIQTFSFFSLLNFLFQIVNDYYPCDFSLLDLWSIVGVANILFLIDLHRTFSSPTRVIIGIKESKWPLLRFFLSATLGQHSVRYDIGLLMVELYHAWRDLSVLLWISLASCSKQRRPQRNRHLFLSNRWALLLSNRPNSLLSRLERRGRNVRRFVGNNLFDITVVQVEIVENI